VLREPQLEFQNRLAKVNNGSWNLRNDSFKVPAKLTTFAVIDMAGGAASCMKGLFSACEKHNVHPPHNAAGILPMVTESVSTSELRQLTPGFLHDKIKEAIGRAKESFIFSKRHRDDFLNTTVRMLPDGSLKECLIPPPPSHQEVRREEVQVVLEGDNEEDWATHYVSNPTDPSKRHLARLAYLVSLENGTESWVDPFDFRAHDNGGFEAKIQNVWERVVSHCRGYQGKL
jgi:hypothetical protein